MQISSRNLQDSQTGNKIQITGLGDVHKLSVAQLASIDPERLNLGTDLQDASIIARAYERGAYYTPTEAAVFAVLNRQLENYRVITKNVSSTLKMYTMVPENSMSKTLQDEVKLAKDAGVPIPGTGGAGVNTGSTNPGANTFAAAFNVNTSGKRDSTQGHGIVGANLSTWAKDCIPCDLRLKSWLQLNPHIDLSNILKNALQGIMQFLLGLGDLLRNLDIFGDFCSLLDMFNFICIPDMQRILMLLSALFTLEIPSLAGLVGMIQCLIAPLFSGLLHSIISLLDQFVLLVANPLQCIVDALQQQLQKLPTGNNPFFSMPAKDAATVGATTKAKKISPFMQKVSSGVDAVRENTADAMKQANVVSQQVGSGVMILTNFIQACINWLKDKLNHYLADLTALMGGMASQDGAFIGASLRKLQIVRLISFVVALITALLSGSNVCSHEKIPDKSDIANFYENYLSTNSPFNLVLQDGELHLTEKNLPNAKNVFEFTGTPLVVAQNLQPIKVVKTCGLKVTANEANTLNKYIAELNQL